jgi:hypothetical protein
MADTNVFISYSHRDGRWLDRLNIHLTPVQRDVNADVWSDTRIKSGDKWRQELESAVDRANVAVLIISPDFLASQFIYDNELPPLLQSAELRGALILPVIASPSLFHRTPSLSQFQAVNPPDRTLLGMSECEQEQTFVKVAERILERHEMASSVATSTPPPTTPSPGPRSENFLNLESWMRLVKIGNWVIDDRNRQIIGAAPRTYLLSRYEYGQAPFEIQASLQFSHFEQHLDKPINKMNAGILIGWNKDKENPRYYNILISGVDIVIERIGFNGGTVVRDYEHVTDPVAFTIEPNKTYAFHVRASSDRVCLSVDGRELVTLDSPVGLEGRVGLRPWRSQLACMAFEVTEKPEQDNPGD